MHYKMTKIAVIMIGLLMPLLCSCNKVTGDIAEQLPALWVTIQNNTGTPIDATHPVYLVFYSEKNWTNPWLQIGSTSDTIIDPAVGTTTTYLMAFLDLNNNGVVDAGEPCTGHENKDHAVPDELTKLEFLPLEWRMLTITLEATRVY